MSQVTDRWVRNFVRDFNEAFAEVPPADGGNEYIDCNARSIERTGSGIRIGNGSSIAVTIGEVVAWFGDDGALCGPLELLENLNDARLNKEAEERKRKSLAADKQRLQPSPVMDMSLLRSIPEEE